MPNTRRAYSHLIISSESMRTINRINEAFSALQDLIEESVPDGRERSVAITDLESASMWATRATLLSDPGSVTP